jgi:hypothetical protein
MIKLFRIIRQQLLVEKRFTKYLLYAFGEIILVVIGILIALSINNWNEDVKRVNEERKYLHNLRDALNDDIASLNKNIIYNKTRLKGIFYILQYAGLDTAKFTEMDWVDISENDPRNAVWPGSFPDTINRNFTELAFSMLGRGFGAVSLNKSVINELYSTGSYSNITNGDLKVKIASYYSFLTKRLEGYAIEEHEEWANETTRFFRDRYGIFTLDVSDLEDPVKLIQGQKDAEHHLRYLALEVNYHCIWSSYAVDMAVDLVKMIEEEYKL